MSCDLVHRHGLDSVLPRLRCRPAATATIQPLVWEPPYASGVILKNKTNIQSGLRNGTHQLCTIPLVGIQSLATTNCKGAWEMRYRFVDREEEETHSC